MARSNAVQSNTQASAVNPTAIALSNMNLREQYNNIVTKITEADSALSEVRGTIGARRTAAREKYNITEKGKKLLYAITNLEERLADTKAAYTHQVDEILAEMMPDSGKVEAIKSSRDALVTEAEAIYTVLTTTLKMEDVPAVPKVTRTRSVGTGVKSTKGQFFYRVEGKDRHDMPSSQNRLSSVAWYAFKHASASELDTQLTVNGVTPDRTKSWEAKGVTINGVTADVGFEVPTT